MGMQYTKEQEQAITLHDRNLLVAAAAGSGKTAVLVERIIQMISNKEKPVDIDRILIVTFTGAAASEMRERISRAIAKKLEEDPSNEHLQRQGTLIHNAQITTIDSFCLFVIRNNFNDIGLDPGFRVVDQGELKLLMKDVLGEVLEHYFEEKNEDFYHLVECYGANGKEKALEEHILKLYGFSMSYPFPGQWLSACMEGYDVSSVEELEQKSWVPFFHTYTNAQLQDYGMKLEQALHMARSEGGPYMYIPMLEEECDMVSRLIKARTYEDRYRVFSEMTFARLSSKKDELISPVKKEMVKDARTEVKDSLLKMKKSFYESTPAQVVADLQGCKRAISMLVQVVQEFMERLSEKKREKNIIDFTDMEHLALEILVKNENGEMVPTDTAKDYQQYFHEIMIDEYQDSNMVQEYLLRSVSKEELGTPNRFMVGDVKQSIYRFRLARPEIFMEKYDTYQSTNGKEQKIDLHQNFRSRNEVIESVNYFFYQIMKKKLGNVEYDDSAALYPGASYPEAKDNQTEIIMIEPDKESKRDQKEVEALCIAEKIKSLVGTFLVTDKDTNLLRPARYKDIAILLRSNAGWDDEFKKALNQAGIPVHVTSKTGYFSAMEIQTLLNMVRILDNPLQDIPLFGVLKSLIGGFSEEEIAKIRNRKGKLYENITQFVEEKSDSEVDNSVCEEGADEKEFPDESTGETIDVFLKEKFAAFLLMYHRYRDMVTYTPIHQLLYLIAQETDFYQKVGAMPGGDQRKANIDMLFEKALAFEQTSYRGLFHFIRYMEQLEKYDIDFGEANILDEHADTVRIMSIHKSKGLEFPICFVAGMKKKFNVRDMSDALIMDIDMGIGTDFIDPVMRTKAATLFKSTMAAKMKTDMLGEELRILYVALTRAKEKLIITGIVDDLEKEIKKYLRLLHEDEVALSFADLSEAGSYWDYIMPALIRHRSFLPVLEQYELAGKKENPLFSMGPEMKVVTISEQQLNEMQLGTEVREEISMRHLQQMLQVSPEVTGLYQELKDRFSFRYPFKNLEHLFTKTTVSELKKATHLTDENSGAIGTAGGYEAVETFAGEKTHPLDMGIHLIEEKAPVPYIPSFVQEEVKMSGTDRGTAYHKIMELLEFDQAGSEEAVKAMMQKFVSDERIPEEYPKGIAPKKIVAFAKTSLAKRMEEAQKLNLLYKEQPFVLGIPASELNAEFPESETLLIQGIIDVFFEEDGELVVADYKTDRVEQAEELVSRYQTQLDYYAKALAQLTGKKVKEKIIYSFALEKEILL